MRRTVTVAAVVLALLTTPAESAVRGTRYRKVAGNGPRHLVVKGKACLTRKSLTTLVLAPNGWQPGRHKVVLICVAP